MAEYVDPVPHLERIKSLHASTVNAQGKLEDAIRAARVAGVSWNMIGRAIGTTGEGARQRYMRLVPS